MAHLLRTGKLSESATERSIWKRIEAARGRDGRTGAVRNADCAFLGGSSPETVAVTSDPVTLCTSMCGRLGVIAAVNDLAAGGAVPEAVNTVILLPPGSPEEELREIEDQIIEVCGEEGLTILGGHTEVTAGGRQAACDRHGSRQEGSRQCAGAAGAGENRADPVSGRIGKACGVCGIPRRLRHRPDEGCGAGRHRNSRRGARRGAGGKISEGICQDRGGGLSASFQ
jgi:thiamine monophosphate kinase